MQCGGLITCQYIYGLVQSSRSSQGKILLASIPWHTDIISLYARIVDLSCWILLHIYKDPESVERIREEIAPFAKVLQRPKVFQISEPLQVDLDAEKLSTLCPNLKNCYLECSKLYSMQVFPAVVKSSANISTQPLPPKRPRSFRVESDTYMVLVCDEDAKRQVLTLVSGILALWDVSSISSNGWELPGHARSRLTFQPFAGIRASFSQRQV